MSSTAGKTAARTFALSLALSLTLATASEAQPAVSSASVATATATANATCLACHAMPNLGYRDANAVARRFAVSPSAFAASVHRGVTCVDCHANTRTYPHAAASARATCDGDCHATDSAGRPYTHARQAAAFRQSVHGRAADRDNPSCLTCHGNGDPHAVAAASRARPAAKMAVCVRCHDDATMMARHDVATDAVASYRRSFHYKAIRFGDTTAATATCTDCHTAHHVLPSNDARSTIASANLTKTCGKSNCHEAATLNFAASGASHLELRVAKEPVLWFEERFFMLLTAGTMAMLFVGIALDIQKKFGWAALARRSAAWAGRRLRRVAAAGRARAGALGPVLARWRQAALRAARVLLYD